MLDVRLFKNHVFAASSAAALFVYMSQFILVFLAPFYLQSLRGFTPSYAGLLYLPMPLATMCVAPISGALSDRVDSRFISSAGALVMAGGLSMLAFVDASTPVGYFVAAMAVTGLGFGTFQTPNNSAIMGGVPPQNRGTASGTMATMRNIGMVLGVAVSGALFEFSRARATEALTAEGLTGAHLSDTAFVTALHNTYLTAVGVALLAMVASFVKGRVRPEREKAGVEAL